MRQSGRSKPPGSPVLHDKRSPHNTAFPKVPSSHSILLRHPSTYSHMPWEYDISLPPSVQALQSASCTDSLRKRRKPTAAGPHKLHCRCPYVFSSFPPAKQHPGNNNPSKSDWHPWESGHISLDPASLRGPDKHAWVNCKKTAYRCKGLFPVLSPVPAHVPAVNVPGKCPAAGAIHSAGGTVLPLIHGFHPCPQ